MTRPLTLADLQVPPEEDFETWLRRTARAGGPLPSHPPSNVAATRWWNAYRGVAARGDLEGGGVAARAGRAGRARAKAEPGIDPATDPRVNVPPGRAGPAAR